MTKDELLKAVKDKLVYSSDKGWHLPENEPVNTQKNSLVGGVNRFFKGSDHEIKEMPRYGKTI